MKSRVKVIVLRTAGTNCDAETAFAFEQSGAGVDAVHIKKLFDGGVRLEDYHILAIPGGFTYGDDVESGRILANELRLRLGEDLRRFIDAGKLMIGICNGFQVLVKAGILPNPMGAQDATLINNDSGKFEDRWVHLKVNTRSVWTQDLEETIYLPVAHAEGKFIPKNDAVLDLLKKNGQVAFRYCAGDGIRPEYPENPNGSIDDIAGITDETGRVLGLMPHPERHFLFTQHPFWTRLERQGRKGDGAKIFENGVRYIQENIL